MGSCPEGAICILPAHPGTCEPRPPEPQECWSDRDCARNQTCEGERQCPPGAYCILPDAPGSCVDRAPGRPVDGVVPEREAAPGAQEQSDSAEADDWWDEVEASIPTRRGNRR